MDKLIQIYRIQVFQALTASSTLRVPFLQGLLVMQANNHSAIPKNSFVSVNVGRFAIWILRQRS
jgi:hypothetical protein